MEKTRALIVDDSALMRRLLTEILSSASDIEVVGSASDPFVARDKIKQLNPDVLTLDVEMPRMDGLTFLRNLMRLHPMPVVMLSSLTAEGADVTLQALAHGAVDFVQKPASDLTHTLPAYTQEIIDKVRMAARCRVRALADRPLASPTPEARPARATPLAAETIIALGASTGGTEAIKSVARLLPAETPAIVISQHLPLAFSASFAKHVDDASAMTAQLAEHGEPVRPGHIYIAPGDRHLKLHRHGKGYRIELNDGPPVNRHKPSVDVMFESVAEVAGAHALGVILTGMGADGARGMKTMHEAGATTIAQDEQSSVVWGMPGEAWRLGGVDHLVPLGKIPIKLLDLLNLRA